MPGFISIVFDAITVLRTWTFSHNFAAEDTENILAKSYDANVSKYVCEWKRLEMYHDFRSKYMYLFN